MAGVGVGRGYLGSPDKTAAAFLPDPFGPPGERLYLSGDLGRWTAAGEIDLLGRLDNQLKVRGHRVELGEVEAALARHPTVRQAAVVARPDGRGGNRLLAYLVADSAPAAADLHAFLAQTLPRPMLPERFVQLAALPLNRNGKVDRAALPEPAGGDAPLPDGYTAPRNHLETVVAGLWQSVLGIDRVGVHDDFFALGGHSLKTIQVRSRIKHELGVELPLRALFDHPTLARLAAEVGRSLDAPGRQGSGGAGVIPRLPEAASYALSHAQRRLWFLQRLDPGNTSYNMPALYRLTGELHRGALQRAWNELLARHAGLRTSFADRDGEPVQRIASIAAGERLPPITPDAPGDRRPAGRLATLDLSALAGAARQAAVRAVLAADARTFFDLDTPPLRACLLVLAADDHLLLVTLHHILADAASWERLARDLVALYEALRAGRATPLPALPIRYVDYAAWQNRRIERGDLAPAEAYWLRQLAGELPALELPADHPRPTVPSQRAGQMSAPLDPAVIAAVRRLGAEHGLTLFMSLFAAATAWLSRLTGQTDLILGTPSSGRDEVSTAGVIGFFVNMLALRVELADCASFADLLARCRQTAVDAFAHQEYPFDVLTQKLNPVRHSGRSPIFDATFAVYEPPPPPAPGSLRIAPQSLEVQQATPFDLILTIAGTGADLTCTLVYSLDLFAPETAGRWLRRFQILLAGAVAYPRLGLAGLPLWTPEEQAQLALQRRPPRDSYPLSFQQRDVWFHCQLRPGTPTFNCCWEVELQGPLLPAVLRRALEHVMRRHEGMRMRFPVVDGRPAQRATTITACCPTLDLSRLTPERQDWELRSWRSGFSLQPFDLENGPLVRFHLSHLGRHHFRLLLVVHHLLTDAVNLVFFAEQTLQAYAAIRRGAASAAASLPPPPLHYQDFAVWQDVRLRLGALAAQRELWRRRLHGALPGLELPPDRARPAAQTFTAGEILRRLPPARLAELKRLRKDLNSSLFRTVLAALHLLLSRLTGAKDLVVAFPVSIRPVEMAEVAAYFSIGLPLRTDLHGDPTFRALAGRVGEAVKLTAANADYPIGEAIASLKVERDVNHPVMPICVSQMRSLARDWGELSALSSVSWTPGIVFDFWLLAGESEGCLEIQLKYNRDLFDPSTVERFVGCLDTLLAGAAANPDARLSDFDLLRPAERQGLLLAHGGGAARLSRDGFADQLVGRLARRRPHAVAAVHRGVQISHGALDRRAEQIARWLRARGIGAEDRVALLAHRGVALLAATLGILKSGAAFVPLDPLHPDARLRAILRSAGVAAVASEESLAERAQALAATLPEPPPVCRCDAAPASSGASVVAPAARTRTASRTARSAENLACVFYTSGSTGVPKGAMVTHRGMLNHLLAKIELLDLDPASAVVANASPAFDISVWQSLAALVAGGRVLIYDEVVASDPEALLAALALDGATVVETVPRFLEAMLDATLPGGDLPQLAYLVSNAETLPVALCRRWFERFPAVALVNTYGATECSDDTTHHVMRRPPNPAAPRVPVGTAIPGLAIHVVDEHLRLLPAGRTGRIAMAGAGVGRGYLGDPAATAASFVPDPLGGSPGGRLYLSGDLGRWTAEDQLDFLGRSDHQVKIRGFRIELGEIEAALARHPAVGEGVVVVRDGAAARHLVAYVVARQGQPCEPAELRRWLAAALPDYMVPAVIVSLADLPRTRTGKVDRRALPSLDDMAPGGGFLAPRNPTEEQLAAIWSGVLGLDRIGVHDRFFDLGGDSILSIQVVSRARQAGLEITPRQLFAHQTIAELAAVARPAAARAGGASPVEGSVPLTPVQQWFFAQDNPDPHHWNMALMLEPSEAMDPRLLAAAWLRLVDHHDALRLRFVRTPSGWDQRNAARESRPFCSHVDLGGLPAGRRRPALTALAERLQPSLDLAAGPLLRVVCCDLGAPQGWRLLVIIHHLAVDVVSWRILLEDLLTAYGQLGRGETVRLAAKSTSFKRWSELLAAYARSSDELRQERSYWLQPPPGPAAAAPPAWPLPQPAAIAAAARRLSVGFGAAETADLLRRLPAVHGTTAEGLLLASLAEAVSRLTGERVVRIELAGHGRQEVLPGVDLTRTVGWFTCAFPLQIDLRAATTIAAAVRCVGGQLARLPNRGLGYGLLRYLAGDAEVAAQLRALPAAAVSFEYLGQLDGGFPPGAPLRLASESPGAPVSPRARFSRPLSVEAKIAGGSLEVTFLFSEASFDRPTVETLAERFAAALRALLAASEPADAAARGVSCRHAPPPPEALPQTLPGVLADAAAAVPAAPFLLWGDGGALSFADVDREARRFAGALRRLGVAHGERVAILLENRPEFLSAMFGSQLAGAVYVAINTHLTAPEAAYIAHHVGAVGLVTEERHLGLAAAIRGLCPGLRWVIAAPASAEASPSPGPGPSQETFPWAQILGEPLAAGAAAAVHPDDLATVQYTSGTTARPKGVMLTHRALLAAVRARARHLRVTADDTMLVPNPLFHLNGQGSIFGCLAVRARVLLRETFSASRFWDDVERHGVTTLNGMQTIPRILLARPPRPEDRRSPLRTVVGALDPELHRAFEERFDVRFVEAYSLTEDPMSVMGPRDDPPAGWSAKHGVIGLPIEPAVHRIRIVGDDGRDLPAGATGEILKLSPALMTGYFGDPEATALALRDGWLYTGDYGRLDAEGCLYFAGRKKDAIKRSGVMISAAEVEAAIASHPGIAEVAVIGVPDPIRSEEVMAFVVLGEGHGEDTLPPEQILAWCAERLAPYKVPRFLEYRRHLPKTATLKIQKESLRALAAADPGAGFDREKTPAGALRRGRLAEKEKP